MGSSGSKREVPTCSYSSDGYIHEVIDCSPYVDTADVSSFIRRNRKRMLESDRLLMQGCLDLLSDEDTPTWVWSDSEFEVQGHNLRVKFFSGSPTNCYLVSFSKDGKIYGRCIRSGIRLKLHSTFRSIWNTARYAAGKVLSLAYDVAPDVIRKAITYKKK